MTFSRETKCLGRYQQQDADAKDATTLQDSETKCASINKQLTPKSISRSSTFHIANDKVHTAA